MSVLKYFFRGSFLIILGLIISVGQAQVSDTISEVAIDKDTVAARIMAIDEPLNEFILDQLDSLVSLKFFTNSTFTTDTATLNKYNFAADFIPEYPDSIVQQRLTDLNLETQMELVFNKQVKNYIHAYSVKRRGVASRVLGLSEVYFPLFEEHLDKYNMPLELKYLAVVESALNPTANSRAGAKGLWQFMYSTGKGYGLKTSSIMDDRFDPYKSTDAACRHLKDLYEIYGNWSLALAAYNSGAGNVNKALRRAGGVKSYWAIWPYLPRETRGYVPAFIAVVYIMNYAAEHNIYPEHPGILFEEIDTVMVNDVLSFDQISEFLEIPMETIKFLNPAYKVGIIPSTKDKKYVLRLPQKEVAQFIDKEKELYAFTTKKGIQKEKLLAEIKKAKERNIHIVRSGENLGVIANKYRCSVNSLKSWNNLRSNTIYPGQKLVVYAPGYIPQPKSTSNETASTDITNRSKNTHTVKNGENLGLIAQKYKCKTSDLKTWNKLKSNTIHPGQKLIVYAPETKAKSQEAEVKSGEYVYHTIKKGDTLWDIAKLYDGVTVDQIKKLNHISNSKRLKPGQKLKVAYKS